MQPTILTHLVAASRERELRLVRPRPRRPGKAPRVERALNRSHSG